MMQVIGRLLLRLGGWTTIGGVPDVPKAVIIAAYHTSNWDAVWYLAFKCALKVRVSFFAKDSLFWWPLGTLLTRLGAIPVDRSNSNAVVEQLVNRFNETDQLFLGLSPEGTRDARPYWRTGFYRIAQAAGVPIVLTHIDYARKELVIGTRFVPNDPVTDLQNIRDYYADVTPRHEHLKGPIAFPPE